MQYRCTGTDVDDAFQVQDSKHFGFSEGLVQNSFFLSIPKTFLKNEVTPLMRKHTSSSILSAQLVLLG